MRQMFSIGLLLIFLPSCASLAVKNIGYRQQYAVVEDLSPVSKTEAYVWDNAILCNISKCVGPRGTAILLGKYPYQVVQDADKAYVQVDDGQYFDLQRYEDKGDKFIYLHRPYREWYGYPLQILWPAAVLIDIIVVPVMSIVAPVFHDSKSVVDRMSERSDMAHAN